MHAVQRIADEHPSESDTDQIDVQQYLKSQRNVKRVLANVSIRVIPSRSTTCSRNTGNRNDRKRNILHESTRISRGHLEPRGNSLHTKYDHVYVQKGGLLYSTKVHRTVKLRSRWYASAIEWLYGLADERRV